MTESQATMDSGQSPDRSRQGKVWSRFSIQSLLLLMVVVATSYSWWKHWHLEDQSWRIERLMRFNEIGAIQRWNQVNTNRVFTNLDIDNPHHRQIFKIVLRLNYSGERISQEEICGNHRVLLFHSEHWNQSLIVTTHYELFDFLIFEEDSIESLSFEDIDNDGRSEVVVTRSVSDSQRARTVYKISDDGMLQLFDEQEKNAGTAT